MKERIEEIVYNYKYPDGGIDYDDAESVAEMILSLFPSLDNLEVVEECRECKGEVVIDHENITLCSSCEDGKVTRAATWEDIDINTFIACYRKIYELAPPELRVIMRCIYITSSLGILRVKGEE